MRLTKAIKDSVTANVIEASGLNERRKANNEREREWGNRVRIAAMGGQAAEDAVKMLLTEVRGRIATLPPAVRLEVVRGADNLVKWDDSLWLNVNGQRHYVALGERVISPNHIKAITADSAFGQEWQEIINERTDIQQAKKRLKAEISGILCQATTVNKLLKVWPEAKDYLPEAEKPPAPVPAVRIGAVNDRIKALSEGADLATVFKVKG